MFLSISRLLCFFEFLQRKLFKYRRTPFSYYMGKKIYSSHCEKHFLTKKRKQLHQQICISPETSSNEFDILFGKFQRQNQQTTNQNHQLFVIDQSQAQEPTFKLEAETLGFCMNACGVGVASDLNVKISAWVLCFCSGNIVRVLDRTFGPFIRFYTKQLNI